MTAEVSVSTKDVEDVLKLIGITCNESNECKLLVSTTAELLSNQIGEQLVPMLMLLVTVSITKQIPAELLFGYLEETLLIIGKK